MQGVVRYTVYAVQVYYASSRVSETSYNELTPTCLILSYCPSHVFIVYEFSREFYVPRHDEEGSLRCRAAETCSSNRPLYTGVFTGHFL